MNYSHNSRKDNQKRRLLTKSDVEGLTYQERRFAQEQFQRMYAEEMSKITTQMNHKKKIQDNLQTIDERNEKHHKQQSQMLKNKMSAIEKKRNQEMEKKVKQYKLNDERWGNKIKQIQNKLKAQKKQAIQKAKQYREQSQKFWKDKEKKTSDHLNLSPSTGIRQQKFQTLTDFEDSFNEEKSLRRVHRNKEKLKKIEIDKQIYLHQQKSQMIGKEKQEHVFQNVLRKMDRIEKTRRKKQREYDIKIQPTKPRIPKRIKSEIQPKEIKEKNASMLRKDEESQEKPKKSLQRLIKEHNKAKHRLEEEQFEHRGEIMSQNHQRNRKDMIKKMLKEKVHELKVNAFKKEGQKNSLRRL